jgi:hypothetical protein
VAVSVVEGVQDRLVGAPEDAVADALVPLGHGDDLAVMASGGDASFDAAHERFLTIAG